MEIRLPARRATLIATAALALSGVAAADPTPPPTSGNFPLYIDPNESYIELLTGDPDTGSAIIYETQVVGAPVRIVAPLGPAEGEGAELPGGSTANGHRAVLTGTIGVDLQDPIGFLDITDSRVLIGAHPSGRWLPGPAGDRGTPTYAALAGTAMDSSFGNARAAIRNLRFVVHDIGRIPVGGLGGGRYQFRAGGLPLNEIPFFKAVDGVVSAEGFGYEADVGMFASLPLFSFNDSLVGLIEYLPDDVIQLTLPIEADREIGRSLTGEILPLTVRMSLRGKIVARNVRPVPEPGGALGSSAALLGIAVLCALRRRGEER